MKTAEEIDAIRQEQQQQKAKPRYYGPWAKDRDLTYDEIKAGKPELASVVDLLRAPKD